MKYSFKKNIGSTDRLVRVGLALLVVVLFYTGVIGGTLALILGIAALLLVLTSLVRFCPVYPFIGISTIKKVFHRKDHVES